MHVRVGTSFADVEAFGLFPCGCTWLAVVAVEGGLSFVTCMNGCFLFRILILRLRVLRLGTFPIVSLSVGLRIPGRRRAAALSLSLFFFIPFACPAVVTQLSCLDVPFPDALVPIYAWEVPPFSAGQAEE